MKKLLFIALVAIAFVSCGKDEQSAFKVKATDKISIKAASNVAKSSIQKVSSVYIHLSALDIVKKTTEISFYRNGIKYGRSFTNEQRDSISTVPKLLMWATDVITLDGQLQPDFIEATDVVLVHYDNSNVNLRDTIAYIPNSVIRSTESAIRTAFADKDINACYTLFNDAYVFTPITGAEWRALKAQNQQ